MMQSKPDPIIRSTARATRVAYVLERNEEAQPWLDAVIADCFRRSGGRQSPIIPAEQARIEPHHLDWLRAFAPDVVYLITRDNDAVCRAYFGLNCPSLSVIALKFRSDHIGVRSEQLSSISWLPFLKASSGGMRIRPERILDSYPQWSDDGIVFDNFGTLERSLGIFPFHTQIADLVTPAVLTPTDAPDDRWHIQIAGDEIASAYFALTEIAAPRPMTTLAYLANLEPRVMRAKPHPWNTSFCLVVGDSIDDRIACWNACHLYDESAFQPYKTLRVPTVALNDSVKVASIAEFLRRANWIGSTSGPPRICIRSCSISEASSAWFVGELKKITRAVVSFEPFKSASDACPEFLDYHTRRALGKEASVETQLRNSSEVAYVPQPFQLEFTTSRHPAFSAGNWMIDFTISRLVDHGRFGNERHEWLIPNRQQTARLFTTHSYCTINSSNRLSVAVDIATKSVQVSQPSDEDFFVQAICGDLSFPPSDSRAALVERRHFQYASPSDKGRYLRGVLGMFQSLTNAHGFLSSHFWRSEFKGLAAPGTDKTELVRVLKKKLAPQAGTLTLSTDASWEKLARVVAGQASTMRVPKNAVTLNQLLGRWRAEITRAIESDPNLARHREEMLAEANEDLKASLTRLCSLSVFRTGFAWTCGHCGYANWNALDALTPFLECRVCDTQIQLPVDFELSFRIDDFLASCLREHDTLSVIWALGELRAQARNSFYFSPQMDLFAKYPESTSDGPTQEVDLICVVDGQLLVGEIKSSLSEIDEKDLAGLAKLAQTIGANQIVIGALEGSDQLMNRKIEVITPSLPKGVQLKTMLGRQSDWEQDWSWTLPS